MDNTNQTYATSSVTSKDDTVIGYRQLGNGPGIILLHGGANASQHFMMRLLHCVKRSQYTFQTAGGQSCYIYNKTEHCCLNIVTNSGARSIQIKQPH